MKKNILSERYGISDAVPTSLTVTKTTISHFASTVKAFFKTNFDGLIIVETEFAGQHSDYITICAEQTAYFFKLLLCSLHSYSVIRIRMSCDNENKFEIRIESDGFDKLTASELYDIVRSAKNAKFIPSETVGGILLTRPYKTSISYRIYATSQNALIEAFDKIFFDRRI